MDCVDDDKNVKTMRDTAREIGLTDVLLRAFNTQDAIQKQELIRQALRLLGMKIRGVISTAPHPAIQNVARRSSRGRR